MIVCLLCVLASERSAFAALSKAWQGYGYGVVNFGRTIYTILVKTTSCVHVACVCSCVWVFSAGSA